MPSKCVENKQQQQQQQQQQPCRVQKGKRQFYRIYGREYRKLAIAKDHQERKVNILLDMVKNSNARIRNVENHFNDEIIRKEWAARLDTFDEEYDVLQNEQFKKCYDRMQFCHEGNRLRSKDALNKDKQERLARKKHGFRGRKLILRPDDTIFPDKQYPRITNYVVIVHFGKNGKNLFVEQKRIHLYFPNGVRNLSFAAAILPQDGATSLFFSNCKTVLTGTTSPESALFALQMYRASLGRVKQAVLVRDDRTSPPTETYEVCYLRTILDFTRFIGTNTVGSGPVTTDGQAVDLSALAETYPDSNWNPEIFPGLKFHLPEGNTVIPGGKKCTAHIFESRVVLMGLEDPKHMDVAFRFFLDVIKPFLVKASSDYEEDRYSYRYKQMLWKLNSTTDEETRVSQMKLSNKLATTAETTTTTTSPSLNLSSSGNVPKEVKYDEQKDASMEHPDRFLANNGNSLFDFDIRDHLLPPTIAKQMNETLKITSLINKARQRKQAYNY